MTLVVRIIDTVAGNGSTLIEAGRFQLFVITLFSATAIGAQLKGCVARAGATHFDGTFVDGSDAYLRARSEGRAFKRMVARVAKVSFDDMACCDD